jgi:hypothetical protein
VPTVSTTRNPAAVPVNSILRVEYRQQAVIT